MNLDRDKILQKAEEIKSKFVSASVDENEVKESFIDKLNQLLQSIFGDDVDAAYELLEKGDLSNYRKSYFKRLKKWIAANTKNFFYLSFMLSIVAFLVSEAVTFYSVDGVVTFKTYVKAILTELSFIFLSGYVAENKYAKVLAKGLLVGVFGLMLFVISAETLKKGTYGSEESKIIAEQIITLEQQIKEKEELIKYYVSIGWPRNATSTRLEKDKLVNDLLELKKQQSLGKNTEVTTIEKYKSYGKAFFRVILLLINMLIARRVFKF
jgi:hypothetical protein